MKIATSFFTLINIWLTIDQHSSRFWLCYLL